MSHPLPEQCAHTFEIIFRSCRVCAGWDRSCRCFETLAEMQQRKEKADAESDHDQWGPSGTQQEI